jgi:hypothetical protein
MITRGHKIPPLVVVVVVEDHHHHHRHHNNTALVTSPKTNQLTKTHTHTHTHNDNENVLRLKFPPNFHSKTPKKSAL